MVVRCGAVRCGAGRFRLQLKCVTTCYLLVCDFRNYLLFYFISFSF